ncbi:MAG: efflux RND transporter periplasmic adaptor subunit [Planctomycetaceae bacterium]|nr:efflux RND transporter periplasmic adaptor subunit [Planctomycetales bacterium]MCB9921208.1 efflux RND transporter periplasmic adaptor subunit [Planctomycetaceae bacterium]
MFGSSFRTTFVGLATLLACDAAVRGQPPQQPVTVIVVPVIQREVSAGQTFVGAVVPPRRSIIGSAVDGRVSALYVDAGDPVGPPKADDMGTERGQPVAQLLTDTISIEIAAAQAEMLLRKHELEEMEAGSRPEEIAEAKARLGAAQAVKDFAKARYERTKALFNQSNTASLDELEQALSASIAADQNEAAAKATADLALAGPRHEEIQQARARLAMATEHVNHLESQKAKYTLRAPFEGYVVAKHTEVGAWVSRGDPVAEVIEVDPIEIDVTVPEAYVAHVRIGAHAQIHVDAVPDQEFTGRVARIVPDADLRSRTFPVKVRLANPKNEDGYALKSGMLARVTLAIGPPTQALLVPKDSLVLGGPRPTLMVVTANPETKSETVRPVPVQLGVTDGSLIQVAGEISAADRVVVIGNERVRPGQPIAAKMQSPQSSRPE